MSKPDDLTRAQQRHQRVAQLAEAMQAGLIEGTKGWDERQCMMIEVLHLSLLSLAGGELVQRWMAGRGLTGFPMRVRGDFSPGSVELTITIDLSPAGTVDDTDTMGAPPSMARH